MHLKDEESEDVRGTDKRKLLQFNLVDSRRRNLNKSAEFCTYKWEKLIMPAGKGTPFKQTQRIDAWAKSEDSHGLTSRNHFENHLQLFPKAHSLITEEEKEMTQ